jgi:CheY-like chemotaxis protein
MKKILVVDNDEMLCRLACDILHTEGYRAVPVTNAADAMAAFEQEDFDLVVTDLGMPGMHGVELARAVQQKQPGLPVIVMTSYGEVECEHVKLWLPKEYLFPRLLEKIRSCLAEGEAEKVAK